jgi:hypothetical protein
MAKRAPVMKVAKAAVDELRSLSASDAELVVTFLQHLAENPYDQALIGSAHANGDLFASSVNDKLYVYWSFDTKRQRQLPGLVTPPKINVLGLARMRANHGFVPVLPITDEKLRSA